MDLSGYLKCLKYVAKMAFNNGWMDRPYAAIVDAELNPNLQTIGQHSNSRHSESKPIYFAVNERAITSIRLGGTTKVRFGRYNW